MKQLSLYCLFGLFSLFSLGQQHKIDSLKHEFKKTNKEVELISILDEVSYHYLKINKPQEAHIYFDSLLLSNKIKSSNSLRMLIHKLRGNTLVYQTFLDSSIIEFRKGLSISNNSKPNKIKGDLYLNIGLRYRDKNATDSFAYYTKLAKEIYTKIPDYRGLCFLHFNLAGFYFDTGDYKECEDHLTKLLEYTKYYKNDFFKGKSYFLLGLLSFDLGNTDDAIFNYKKSLEIFEESNDFSNYMHSLTMLGVLYSEDENNYQKAKNIFDESMAFHNVKKLPKDIVYTANLINYSGLLINIGESNKAQYYVDMAKENIKTKHIQNFFHNVLTMHQAEIYFNNGKINESINELALVNLNEIKPRIKLSYYDLLIKINKKTKNYNSAISLFEEKLKIIDSIYDIKSQKNIAYNSSKFESKEKEKENLQLKADNAEQALLTQKANTRNWLLAIGLLSVLLIAFFIWKRYKSEAKAKQTISDQKDVIEELQKELHHRVKNNLNIIDAFVDEIKDDYEDSELEDKLEELQNRIASINEVHTQLYQSTDVTNVNLKKYIESLAKNVASAYHNKNVSVSQQIKEDLKLQADKSSVLGLIINEFLTNSYKYAFDDEGEIKVNMNETEEDYILKLSDNGKGLSKDFDINTVGSYGLRIMKLLSRQLRGTFEIKNNNGVELNIQFPKT